MNEKVYKATIHNKDGVQVHNLFIPFAIEGDQYIGDYGWINYLADLTGRVGYNKKNHNSEKYSWNKNGFEIVEANSIEAEWYRLCTAAGKLVNKPKEVIMFPIY